MQQRGHALLQALAELSAAHPAPTEPARPATAATEGAAAAAATLSILEATPSSPPASPIRDPGAFIAPAVSPRSAAAAAAEARLQQARAAAGGGGALEPATGAAAALVPAAEAAAGEAGLPHNFWGQLAVVSFVPVYTAPPAEGLPWPGGSNLPVAPPKLVSLETQCTGAAAQRSAAQQVHMPLLASIH